MWKRRSWESERIYPRKTIQESEGIMLIGLVMCQTILLVTMYLDFKAKLKHEIECRYLAEARIEYMEELYESEREKR